MDELPKAVFMGVTQRDTDRANRRVFRSKRSIRGDSGVSRTVTFDKGSYIHEIGQDASDVESGSGGGGGLPDGYVETDVILCQNGSPVNGKFLFKEDEE